MAKDTKTLQDMLAERASKRLNNDLRAISNTIRENRLLAATDSPMPVLSYEISPAKGEQKANVKTNQVYWMLQDTSAFMDAVRAYWLPIYITEETENFMKKVDELDEQIQDLKNGMDREEY
jgi:hypothetical protein